MAIERRVNPVVAVMPNASVAGRRTVASAEERPSGIEHLVEIVPDSARVARATRQEVVKIELRLVGTSAHDVSPPARELALVDLQHTRGRESERFDQGRER